MSPATAPSIWKAILAQGAIPMGSNAWNKLRILRGTELLRYVHISVSHGCLLLFYKGCLGFRV